MYIKASGRQLADVSMKVGYAIVNPKKIVEYFENTPFGQIDKAQEKEILNKAFIEGERPSIETFLHSITDIVTLHTHPVLVNIIATRKNGLEELKSLFPNAMFVSYVTPGINLAKEYFRIWKENGKKSYEVIFLKNHGLIVSGKSAEEVINKNEAVLRTIAEYLNINCSDYTACTHIYNELSKAGIDSDIVYLAQNRYIYEAFHHIGKLWNHKICPDCIVYCGKKILELSNDFDKSHISEHLKKYGKPIIIKYKNCFYIVAPDIKKAKEIESVLGFSAQIALANCGCDMDTLSSIEEDFLLNWDAEKYRRII